MKKSYILPVVGITTVIAFAIPASAASYKQARIEPVQPLGNYCYPTLAVPPVVTYDDSGTAHVEDHSAQLAELSNEQGQVQAAVQRMIAQEKVIARDNANDSSPEVATLNYDVQQYNNLIAQYDTCANQ